jgi:5-formyltetrahydrofolate cyclo-ligase
MTGNSAKGRILIMSEQKRMLRRRMLDLRESLSPEQVRRESLAVCERLVRHPVFKEGETILFYFPFRKEVDVRPAMEEAWSAGKRVVLPKADPATKTLSFFSLRRGEPLVSGSYGIPEPSGKASAKIPPGAIDLVVVPGVAFDERGYRLGYGGGYYDRFFSRHPGPFKRIGVAYSFQVVPTVCPEEHDQRLDGLITPSKTLSF